MPGAGRAGVDRLSLSAHERAGGGKPNRFAQGSPVPAESRTRERRRRTGRLYAPLLRRLAPSFGQRTACTHKHLQFRGAASQLAVAGDNHSGEGLTQPIGVEEQRAIHRDGAHQRDST